MCKTFSNITQKMSTHMRCVTYGDVYCKGVIKIRGHNVWGSHDQFVKREWRVMFAQRRQEQMNGREN